MWEGLRQVVREELEGAFDRVEWELEEEAEQALERLPGMPAEVLFFAAREALRNAARHGRGEDMERKLGVRVRARWEEGLELVVEDEGVGLEEGGEAGGAGQGVALHSTMLAVLGGAWESQSEAGKYTRVRLRLPAQLWREGGELSPRERPGGGP
jgi:signal transduction histidine kinase